MCLKIRYCGGCNPAYDRVKFVNSLVEKLKTSIPGGITINSGDEPTDHGILVCGCLNCCADSDTNKDSGTIWHVIGPDLLDYWPLDMEKIIAAIIEILKKVPEKVKL
jgi:hypothetical protein